MASQAVVSRRSFFARVGLAAAALAIAPLAKFVHAQPAQLDISSATFNFWRNQALTSTSSAVTWEELDRAMRATYSQCRKGPA